MMWLPHPWRSRILRGSAGVGSVWLSAAGYWLAGGAVAQSLSACQPPRPNEYLLLVLNQKPDTQSQLQAILPTNAVLTTCDYLSNSVVRVESFANTEVANAWAQYLSDIAGLQAFVARPNGPTAMPVTTTPAAGGTSSPAASTAPDSNAAELPIAPAVAASNGATSGYNLRPLGSGYAVLVNYFNRPEVAADVRQVTAREVGLAAFEQRPYLLAVHTTDAATASTVLKSLSDRGFTASIVDSRQVILLTPAVAGTGES